MHNKKPRFERARTAPRSKNRIEERTSFGEEAKQELRNMSLINSSAYEDNKQIEWTKDQDNLSVRSFDRKPEKTKKTYLEGKGCTKFKKTCNNTRNSSPVLSQTNQLDAKRTSKPCKKQLVPSNLNLNDNFNDLRIHTTCPKHNIINQQLRLFNEVIFRKTANIINRSFRPTARHKSQENMLEKRHKSQNYLALNFKKGCNKILPLQVQYPIGVDRQVMSKSQLASQLQEKLKQKQTNLVRKLLKQKRMNTRFNENIITQREIKPQF